MENVSFEILHGADIEQCRELCNELMAFQKSKAVLSPEIFDAMNFDTRMKKSFESTPDSQVVAAKDSGTPVGYVFSTIERISDGDKSYVPDWAPLRTTADYQGFYPDWEKLPARCGCLNNLYLREPYKHKGYGAKLYNMAMEWMKSFDDVDVAFVYISNGNESALKFYLKQGFVFSHNVFGGFIVAAYHRFTR